MHHLLRVSLEGERIVRVRELRAEARSGRVRALHHHPPLRGVSESAQWLVVAAQPLEQRRAAIAPRAARCKDQASRQRLQPLVHLEARRGVAVRVARRQGGAQHVVARALDTRHENEHWPGCNSLCHDRPALGMLGVLGVLPQHWCAFDRARGAGVRVSEREDDLPYVLR